MVAPITALSRSPKPSATRLTCGGRSVRTRMPMPSCSQGCKRAHESHWRLPFIQTIGSACVLPGREKIGDRISPYVSGAPQELLHAWQEGSTPHRDAGPTRTQRHSYDPGHLYADFGPGSGQDGEPSDKPHLRLGGGGRVERSSVRGVRKN